MNGLNCGTPSSIAWPYLRGGLDAAIAVTDADAREAVAALSSAGVNAGSGVAAKVHKTAHRPIALLTTITANRSFCLIVRIRFPLWLRANATSNIRYKRTAQ